MRKQKKYCPYLELKCNCNPAYLSWIKKKPRCGKCKQKEICCLVKRKCYEPCKCKFQNRYQTMLPF